MLYLNVCFKELLYMLCMSEASGINSVQKSIVGGYDSRNQMRTKKICKTEPGCLSHKWKQCQINRPLATKGICIRISRFLAPFHCLLRLEQQEVMSDLKT